MPLTDEPGRLAPIEAAEFVCLMRPFAPFSADRRIAVAVSGGADSMALAFLAARWGQAEALIVDHGVRPESAAEASLTADRLCQCGIPAQVLQLNLARGPALAARARAARYRALSDACEAAGLVDLLVAHHAGDQAETLLMRRAAGSGEAGMAGMAAVVHTAELRILRPLLSIAPARLRATLRRTGWVWVEDPSNRNPEFLRTRLRCSLDDPDGTGPATQALRREAASFAQVRAAVEAERAAELARLVRVYPGGFAVCSGALSAGGLSDLIWTISGRAYPPAPAAVSRLVAPARGATLHGVRLIPSRLIPAQGNLWVAREAAAMSRPVPASPGAVWDGRFRLSRDAALPEAAELGPLGLDTATLRSTSPWPAAVLATLPALRYGGELFAVPHLDYPDTATCRAVKLTFCPAKPAAGAAFVPA